ncbi:hypothetical protein J1N35_004888 [Gossypium stocksii]|uniref:Uncharacterized protein n=1 Tax=Gossypium stocksii TaxID=47602 RepID=A0A9D4AIG4_9ROSI|nr:hypothetical protein J1N35_004888 [Gossypium stocksii]
MAMDSGVDGQSHKAHHSRHSGASAKKKTKAKNKDQNSNQKQQNPKAFAFRSNAKAKRLQSLAVEKEQRRLHIPIIDRSYGKLPLFVVVVQGPPQVHITGVVDFSLADVTGLFDPCPLRSTAKFIE